MLCRLIVTCALLGHVALALPSARAPRYTPLPDEVDSDETRRVLGSSVVTSVSVIMDLGNGSQALFSEPSGGHHGNQALDSNGNPESSIDNPLSHDKRPVGSPPALLSPDRYEFYTFDESGELVRRLMTLEQIQSLIAGGDDANRLAALPLDVEMDTVPAPTATDPQGQVVANVQQVLAEELLASTFKNGTEPQETEVEVEAVVQEVPPPSSSPKPEHEDELPSVKVSTEIAPEVKKPTGASPAQQTTDAPLSTVLDTSESTQQQTVDVSSSSTETPSQEETIFKDVTSMGAAENESGSTASSVPEVDSAQEIVSPSLEDFHDIGDNGHVKDTQIPVETITEGEIMSDDNKGHSTPIQSSTEKVLEVNVPISPSISSANSDDLYDSIDSASFDSPSEEGSAVTDVKVPEAPVKPSMEIDEIVYDKISETPIQSGIENEEEFDVKLPEVSNDSSQEAGEVTDIKHPVEPNADSEESSNESEFTNKNPPELSLAEQSSLQDNSDELYSSEQTLSESTSDVHMASSSDRPNIDTTPNSVVASTSTKTSSDSKDAIDDSLPAGILVADLDEIPSSSIPSESHTLEEADLTGVYDEYRPSDPTVDNTPDLADNAFTIGEGPFGPMSDLHAVLQESPMLPETVIVQETDPVLIPVIPPFSQLDGQRPPPEAAMPVDQTDKQEIATPTGQQDAENEDGADYDDEEEEEEEAEEHHENLLDQLAESVSSVLSQVSDFGGDSEEVTPTIHKTQDISSVAPVQQPQDAAPTSSTYHSTELDSSEGDEVEDVLASSTESSVPDETLPVVDWDKEEEGDEIPTGDDANKEEDSVELSDQSVIKTPTSTDTKESDVQKEQGDAIKHGAATTVVKEKVTPEALAPTGFGIESQDIHVDGEKTKEESTPTPTSHDAPVTVEESNIESEPSQQVELGSVISDGLEKESGPAIPTVSGVDEEKVNLPNVEDLENMQAALEEESVSKEPEAHVPILTEIPEINHSTVDTIYVTESSSKSPLGVDDAIPAADNVSGEKKVEKDQSETTDESVISDAITVKPTVSQEVVNVGEGNAEGAKVVESEGENKNEEKEKPKDAMTTMSSMPEDSIVSTTEKLELAEKEGTTGIPPSEVADEKVIQDQPTHGSEFQAEDSVKEESEDQVLIDEFQKEAEKASDPLLGGEKDPVEASTAFTPADDDKPIPSDIAEPPSSGSDDEKEFLKDEMASSIIQNTTHPFLSDDSQENKPTESSTVTDLDIKEHNTSPSPSAVDVGQTKPAIVEKIEQPIDATSPAPSKNPWASIPIPLHAEVSTTSESNKQSTMRPLYVTPTPSTAYPDKLVYPSGSPDDLPDPNGLLPLLNKNPSQPPALKPTNEPLSSTTGKPSTSYSSSTPVPTTTAAANTTGGTGGMVVPPLMPAFPQAPSGNAGLEATASSTDPDVKRFVDLCNDLAFVLYGQVTSGAAASSVPATRGANGGGVQTRSLVVSPFAIFSLLAMIFLGARGPTSEQMNDLLRLDDMITFNPHLVLQNVTDAVITSPGVSAAAFVRELYSDKANGKLLEFYKARAKAFYDGHVEEVDFKEVNDVIRRRTNHLVRWQTRGRVPEYLRGSSLKLRPPLAALSANFFEADCQRASSVGTDGEMYFEVPATGRRRRRLVPVPAVVWRGVFLAGHEPGLDATVLELRHGGGEVSTVLVLPGRHGQSIDAGDVTGGLSRLENWLIAGGRNSWSTLLRSALPRGPLEVQLPRFAHRSVLNATGALSRMGLHDLFEDGQADLRGLDGGLGGKLHLADMIQMTAFGVCADDGSSKRHLETYPSAQRTGRKHTRSLRVLEETPEEIPEEMPETAREDRSGWSDELAREEDDSYVFAAAVAARELPLALRPRQARIPRPSMKHQSRVVLPRLRFDRPFLYFVRHNPSGFILLMGRFNPRLFP